MHNERGQASVEWVGLVLLLALGLALLARFAPRTDPAGLGPDLLHAMACATSGGCAAPAAGGAARRASGPRPTTPRTLVTAPPLVPVPPRQRGAPAARPLRLPGRRTRAPSLARSRPLPAPLVQGRAFARRFGRRAGAVYRRSWMFCLGYERVRYDLLHPKSSAPHQGIPISESIRMANDCVSPVDLVRDYALLRGNP